MDYLHTQLALSSDVGANYQPLQEILNAKKFKEADQETSRIICLISNREQHGWLRNEDILNFPCTDLQTICKIWEKYSEGKFGFSIQKRIYDSVGKDWDLFGERVGWKVNDSWLNYSDLTFDLNAPEGHLPCCPGWVRLGRAVNLRVLFRERDDYLS